MSTENTNANAGKQSFDLEERTAKFGEQIIRFVKSLEVTPITRSLINQVVRSSTSIGANYCEANDADTKKDFRYKIGLCRKEAKETKHWLRMLATACEPNADNCRVLWQEANELNLIFSKIQRSCVTSKDAKA